MNDRQRQRYWTRKSREKRANGEYDRWVRGEMPTRMKWVASEDVLEAVEKLVTLYGDQTRAATAIGAHESLLRRVLSGEQRYMKVETAEHLLMSADMLERIDSVISVPGKAGWNKAGDVCCRGCGTFFHPHQAKGLCRLCYHREYYGCKVDPGFVRFGWSRTRQSCAGCGTNERRHYAHGFCKACYHDVSRGRKPGPKDRNCRVCGQKLPARDPRRKYCQGVCTKIGNDRKRKKPPKRTECTKCTRPMPEGAPRHRKYCSEDCRHAAAADFRRHRRAANRDRGTSIPAPA